MVSTKVFGLLPDLSLPLDASGALKGARGGLKSSNDEHLDGNSLQGHIAGQRCAAKGIAVRLSRYERPKVLISLLVND